MSDAPAVALAHEVAHAHGADALASADHVSVAFSSGGLAFAAKGQRHALTDVEALLHTGRQSVTLAGRAPRPWKRRVVDGDELAAGLAHLRSGSRRIRWQPQDVGTFAAAALWTYVMMPLLVGQAERAERLPDAGGRRRLRLQLPPAIAGHGPVQTLHIDPDGLIRRHDYTATAFGSWARGAQVVDGYRTFDGVAVGTTRRVTPRLGRPLPFPTLVWIEIQDVRLAPT